MALSVQAVLFDIDNTLILFNERRFFEVYVASVAGRFSDLFGPTEFTTRLMAASRDLMDNRGQMSNAAYFMDRFCAGMSHDRDLLWSRFMDYYETAFDEFKVMATPVAGVCGVIEALKARGLRLAAASNAFWPRSVQALRLGWAGLDPGDFDPVTALENARFLKPQTGFFVDVAGGFGLAPEACLMVGNDPVNDMAAQTAGMRTYLCTDSEGVDSELAMSRSLHQPDESDLPVPDGRGTLSALPEWIDGLDGPL